MKPHVLRFTFDEFDYGPGISVECPYDLESDDRPCVMHAGEWASDPASAREILKGECGLIHWLAEGGAETIKIDGQLDCEIPVKFGWDADGPVVWPIDDEDSTP